MSEVKCIVAIAFLAVTLGSALSVVSRAISLYEYNKRVETEREWAESIEKGSTGVATGN